MDSVANTVLELAGKHFGNYKIKNGEVIPTYCPLCGGGEHRDTDTFAIGMHNGLWNCKRGSCKGIDGLGKRDGNLKSICDYFGETSFEFSALPKTIHETKKVYVKPDPEKLLPPTEEVISYFARRGISKATVDDFKIASDEKGNIVFPFYRDGELVFVKYRAPRMYKDVLEDYNRRTANMSEEEKKKVWKPQKEWREKNTEPILFGMDNVSFGKPLVITEGQIDAMSLYEAGVHNVVSVPSGCEDLEWVTLCWSWLDKFNQIILFGDSDDAGMNMVHTLMRRFGEDKCMIPETYPEAILNGKDMNRICKDANDILRCYGPEALKALVDACEPAPVRGVLEVASIPRIDPTTVPRIMTKINGLDKLIGGFPECGLTVISGQRGEGKSTICSSFILQAIEQGFNVCAYSAELSPQGFTDWILLPAVERNYISYVTDTRSDKNICMVPYDIEQRVRKWLAGKLYLFDNGEVFEENETNAILKVFDMCARRYGCKLFLVDNLMTALCAPDEENKAQARFAAKLKVFANKYKAHVLLIAHPRKRQAGQVFTNDEVSGSSAITNLATTVLNIEKPNIRVTKNREFGETGFIPCEYDPVNHRIYQKNYGDHVRYSWDHTGIQEPVERAMDLEEFKIKKETKESSPF